MKIGKVYIHLSSDGAMKSEDGKAFGVPKSQFMKWSRKTDQRRNRARERARVSLIIPRFRD